MTRTLATGVLAAALAAHAALPAAEAGGQGATGRLAGTVTLTLATSARSTASAYESRGVTPRPKPQPESRNVIIFIDGLAGGAERKVQSSIEQKNEQFIPHVVAITTGSSVDFPNADPFFHNVFSLSRGATFDLGRYAPGTSRSHVFRRPGIVKVFCQIHSHMSAVVRVFDHGWFTIPNDGGSFVIEGVPAGERTVVAWHERIGESRDSVTIRPGQTTQIEFTLPVLESEK
jgi:plastocyanin